MTDWLFHAGFVDYQQPDELVNGCDPILAHDTWYRLPPSTIALTEWGTEGWSHDSTWLLLYHTLRDAIRVYHGEGWIPLHDLDHDDPNERWEDVETSDHSLDNKLAVLSWAEDE